MNKDEIIKKLNENNNFHLTFKVIEFVNEELLNQYSNYLTDKNIIHENVTQISSSYMTLKNAYENNVKIILCTSDISFLLPQLLVLDNDDINKIRPEIPVYYCLKDNKKIQNIKTTCNRINLKYYSFKNNNDLFIEIASKYIQKDIG